MGASGALNRPRRKPSGNTASTVSFQIIWRLFFRAIWRSLVRTIRLATGLYCSRQTLESVDEAALSRQGKPAFPPPECPPDSGLPGPAVPDDAYLGLSVDSSRLSLFGRRFVSPDLDPDWIPSALPHRD